MYGSRTGSLYGAAVDDWFEDYDREQVRDRLEPYLKYIGEVEKYYWEHPLAVIECKIIDSPGAKSNRGVWMDLGGATADVGAEHAGEYAARRPEPPGPGDGRLDPHLVQQIMDPEKTRWVYEYGEERLHWIRIVDRDAERMRIQLERRPGTKKVQILRDTYPVQAERGRPLAAVQAGTSPRGADQDLPRQGQDKAGRCKAQKDRKVVPAGRGPRGRHPTEGVRGEGAGHPRFCLSGGATGIRQDDRPVRARAATHHPPETRAFLRLHACQWTTCWRS